METDSRTVSVHIIFCMFAWGGKVTVDCSALGWSFVIVTLWGSFAIVTLWWSFVIIALSGVYPRGGVLNLGDRGGLGLGVRRSYKL